MFLFICFCIPTEPWLCPVPRTSDESISILATRGARPPQSECTLGYGSRAQCGQQWWWNPVQTSGTIWKQTSASTFTFKLLFLIYLPFAVATSVFFQLSRIMKQVRHRLAACQTVQENEDFSGLPGGIWKVSSTTDVGLSFCITVMAMRHFTSMWC